VLAASQTTAPQGRRWRSSGRHYVIASRVKPSNHSQVAEFSISNSLQCELARTRLWYQAAIMFKSDRPSMIMLSVNAGVPLVFLVAVVGLIVRNIVLA
jgi:hypothetical protein